LDAPENRLRFERANLFQGMPKSAKFDLIIGNLTFASKPPSITKQEIDETTGTSLDTHRLIEGASERLGADGRLLLLTYAFGKQTPPTALIDFVAETLYGKKNIAITSSAKKQAIISVVSGKTNQSK
jgi:hypothetical protein